MQALRYERYDINNTSVVDSVGEDINGYVRQGNFLIEK